MVYTIWGQAVCPFQAITLQSGNVAQAGGKLQCLQGQSQPLGLSVPLTHTVVLHPLYYTSTFDNTIQPIPCAVCYVPNRTSKVVNVGTPACPISWSTEYVGALITSHLDQSNTICVTRSFLEQEVKWEPEHNLNDISLVESACSSASCTAGPVSCAMCTL